VIKRVLREIKAVKSKEAIVLRETKAVKSKEVIVLREIKGGKTALREIRMMMHQGQM